MSFGVPAHTQHASQIPSAFKALAKFWVVSCCVQNIMLSFRVTGTLLYSLKLLSLWLLPDFTSPLLCSGNGQSSTHGWCQARTSPPGENLVHSNMTTIKEKTTATSRHVSTNKAGMKSERNPTFFVSLIVKKKDTERVN